MEQQFSNRSAPQAQPQQHVYNTPPYTVYASQPPYISATYQAPQPQQMSYPQATNRYTTGRQLTPNQNLSAQGFTNSAAPTSTQMPQRRIANSVGTVGGGMLSQGGNLSGVSSHHQRFSSASEPSHTMPTGPFHTVGSFASHNRQVSTELPLRMVVDAKYVGAIIGQGGSSIREITRDSKARCVVDVQKAVRDQLGNAEKVISILGQPESCSRACMRILEVVRREMEKDGSLPKSHEYELKLRAHNQLVGRLIGKGGGTIKKIMEDTGAVVFVSNEPATSREGGLAPQYGATIYPAEMSLYTERTITVKGQDMNTVIAAEQRISQKLRQSYESDLNNRVIYPYPQAPGTLPLMNPLGCADPTAYLGATGSSASAHLARLGAAAPISGNMGSANQQVQVVRMWVPNTIVGALIGPKGINIRNVIRWSGAHVKIEGGVSNKEKKQKAEGTSAEASATDAGGENKDLSEALEGVTLNDEAVLGEQEGAKKEAGDEEDASKTGGAKKDVSKEKVKDLHPEERLVTITGNEQQQYKAQYWIHQRVSEQTYTYFESLLLCTEVSVPSKIVGRIVGKGGQNVRELQHATGAQVKIPEDSGDSESRDTTTVRILGNFRASQAVQARLAQLTREFADRLTLWTANGQTPAGKHDTVPGMQKEAIGAAGNDVSGIGAKPVEFASRP